MSSVKIDPVAQARYASPWSRPAPSSGTDPVDQADLSGVNPGPARRPRGLRQFSFKSALRACASMLGLSGLFLETPPLPACLEPGLAKLKGSSVSGKPIDAPGLLKLIRRSEPVHLEGHEVRGIDEACFYLYMKGHAEDKDVAHPELARVLRRERDEAGKALAEYRSLTTDPEATLNVKIPVSSGNYEGEMTFAQYRLSEVREPGFPERLAATREAIGKLRRRIGTSGLDAAWKLVNDPAVDHHGRPLAERVDFAGAANRPDRGGVSPEIYAGLLEMAERKPPDEVLKLGPSVTGLPTPQALLALKHLEHAHTGFYLVALGVVKDPELALKISELRQTPEGDAGYLKLADISLARDDRTEVLRAWAGAEGNVDVSPVDRSNAKFFANLWSRIPCDQHERFCRLPKEPAFDELEKAYAASPTEDRLQAWLAWFPLTKSASATTELVGNWRQPDIDPRDVRDFGQVLQRHQGKPGASLKDWDALSSAPSRDLAMALYHAQEPDLEGSLSGQGLARPDRAAALRALVEGKVSLDAALDALDFLEPRVGEKRSLPELAADYLEVASQLDGDHRRTRAALRRAFAFGPQAGESLAVALKATGELATALPLVPLVERPDRAERMVNLELATRLAPFDSHPEAVARLLVESQLDEPGRQNLPEVVGTTDVRTRLEDYLGCQATAEEPPLTRLARAGDLLRQNREPDVAAAQLAARMQAAFGEGDWSQPAAVLVRLGPSAVRIARDLGDPEGLRQALPLLSELQDPGKDWLTFSTPVADESLAERCQAARDWLSRFPGDPAGAASSWAALTLRGCLPEVLEDGLRLRQSLSPWPENLVPAIEQLHHLERRSQVPFGQLVDEFGAALGRLGAKAALQGLDLKAVLREMAAPGSESKPAVHEDLSSVTLQGVRVRKRST